MAEAPKSNLPTGSSQRPKRPVRPHDNTDLVLTPGGLRPRSLVHRLEPGQHVSTKGGRVRIIKTATGAVVKDLGEAGTPGTSESTANCGLRPHARHFRYRLDRKLAMAQRRSEADHLFQHDLDGAACAFRQ